MRTLFFHCICRLAGDAKKKLYSFLHSDGLTLSHVGGSLVLGVVRFAERWRLREGETRKMGDWEKVSVRMGEMPVFVAERREGQSAEPCHKQDRMSFWNLWLCGLLECGIKLRDTSANLWGMHAVSPGSVIRHAEWLAANVKENRAR